MGKKSPPVRTVPKSMTSDKLQFEKMIDLGGLTGKNGFRAQTVNGTASWQGTGWNRVWDSDSERQDMIEPKGVWLPGRSNRTGE